ncbi:MAG: flagellar hook-associated protein FlgK, partial [Anaerolineales bacterium]|nr:flagellar hook-associated protein FlgK [Anaerolineales bacterium]
DEDAMPSTFYGINLALRAVLSQQNVMQVIEHNVANANTPGYRRQQAVLVAGLPYAPPNLRRDSTPGQYGGSVMVDRVQRFNLEFFDGRFRRELGDAKRWEAERDTLQQVEAALAENTTDGLLPKLDAFWSGWQSVSADPTNTALRADLVERSQALVDGVNRRATALSTLRTDQDLAVRQRVEDINTMASTVASLNVEIARVMAVGDEPNDLLDERDRLLDQLSEVAGAESHMQPNGEMIVSIGGHVLVMGATTLAVTANVGPTATDPARLARLGWQDGQPFNVPRGELAGLLDARDRVVVGQQTALDTFAQTLFAQVNAAHVTGFALNGAATGIPFFEPPDTTAPANPAPAVANNPSFLVTPITALNLRLSSQIKADVANIAAAQSANAPGDGNNARAIFDIQSRLVANGNTATLNQSYTALVGVLGLEVRHAVSAAEDRGLVADSLDKQRESVGGVNLDEEAANLAQAQRAYNAAARLMTTMDDMLDRIINGMGRVGL